MRFPQFENIYIIERNLSLPSISLETEMRFTNYNRVKLTKQMDYLARVGAPIKSLN